MTRENAKDVLCELINSGILDETLEVKLRDIISYMCEDKFESCLGTDYCNECKFKTK